MKIKLVGRPGKMVQRGSTLVTVLDVAKPPKLPRELPDATDMTMSYIIYLPEKLWRSIESSLVEETTLLDVYGDCFYDTELKALSVFVTNAAVSIPRLPKPRAMFS